VTLAPTLGSVEWLPESVGKTEKGVEDGRSPDFLMVKFEVWF
jgi:hypothetical protein